MNAQHMRKQPAVSARERRRAMEDIIEFFEDYAPRMSKGAARDELLLIEAQAGEHDEVWQSLAYVTGRQLWNCMVKGTPVSKYTLGLAARILMDLGTDGYICERFEGVPFVKRPERRRGRRRGPGHELRDYAMTARYLEIVAAGKTKQYARDVVGAEFNMQETAVKQAIRRCRKLID